MAKEKVKETQDLEILEDGVQDVLGSLDDVMSTQDTEYLTFKGWGGNPIRIGSLTSAQLQTFLENNNTEETKRRNGRMLIVLSLVNKKGTRLVDPHDIAKINEAIDKLGDKDAKINGKIIERILIHNGMNQVEASKEAAKND